jgi:hypothetical protein
MPGGPLAKAQAFTGPREKPGLLQAALKASIDGESARPLAANLGGGRRAAEVPGVRLHRPALGTRTRLPVFRPVILGGRAGSRSFHCRSRSNRSFPGSVFAGQRQTFVAALRCDGIEAPGVFGGPINSAWFLAYVEQCLLPTRCGQATSSLPTIWEPRKTKQYETPFAPQEPSASSSRPIRPI